MLTPLDIQSAVFHRTWRGYREAEVDEFLDRVVVEYEQLYRENLALKAQLQGEGQVASAVEPALPAPRATGRDEGAGRPGAREEVAAEVERLRLAAREERRRLEALRQQHRLFATQFQAMLESYRTMLADQEAGPGAPEGRGPGESPA